MVSSAIPLPNQDDIRLLGPSDDDLKMLNGNIGSTYLRLREKAKTTPGLVTPDEWYIMALTRVFAGCQRELKETMDLLRARKGFEGRIG